VTGSLFFAARPPNRDATVPLNFVKTTFVWGHCGIMKNRPGSPVGPLSAGGSLNLASLDDWDSHMDAQPFCAFMQGALKFVESRPKFWTSRRFNTFVQSVKIRSRNTCPKWFYEYGVYRKNLIGIRDWASLVEGVTIPTIEGRATSSSLTMPGRNRPRHRAVARSCSRYTDRPKNTNELRPPKGNAVLGSLDRGYAHLLDWVGLASALIEGLASLGNALAETPSWGKEFCRFWFLQRTPNPQLRPC